MRRKRRKNKQMKFIMISSLSLLFILTTGYAAFSTNLNITAKGNILEKPITIKELKDNHCNQTSGDGLYKDTYENERCIYRGTNPNNYITFNNELWRIISIESDNTLKIIKNDSIVSVPFDPGYKTSVAGVTSENSITGTRWSNTSTDYCYYLPQAADYNGCNIWGSKTTMLNSAGTNISKMPKYLKSSTTYNLPEKEAYINTYLNNSYYRTLSNNSQNIITSHNFRVGILDNISKTLDEDITQEKNYLWKGKVGLVNVTDFIRASTNASCINIYSGIQSDFACGKNNFMSDYSALWTMNAFSNSYSNYTWIIYSNGHLSTNGVFNSQGIYPVLYLSSDIKIKGKGSLENPFIIS